MTYSFLRGFSLILVLAALFGYVGCSGTNTGNGTAAGTGGAGYNLGTANTGGAPNTGGAANTGGTQGACPYLPCSYPVNVTGSDGTTYRGRIIPDISIACNPIDFHNYPVLYHTFPLPPNFNVVERPR